MILKTPSDVDMNASEVGTQEWKAEENLPRYWLVGVQCSGMFVAAARMEKDIVARDGLANGRSRTSQPEEHVRGDLDKLIEVAARRYARRMEEW